MYYFFLKADGCKKNRVGHLLVDYLVGNKEFTVITNFSFHLNHSIGTQIYDGFILLM